MDFDRVDFDCGWILMVFKNSNPTFGDFSTFKTFFFTKHACGWKNTWR